MSRTDKTRPYWVQLRDPGFKWPIRQVHRHNHYFGDNPQCDIDFPMPRVRVGKYRGCEYWPRWLDNDKIWGRPRYRRSFGSFQDRRARADLRRLKAEWLREPIRGDIDSTENLPTRRWLWARWYWD